MEGQIPLALSQQEHASFENFMGADEQRIIPLLQQVGLERSPHLIYLWGGEGSGKSHLVHAACNLLDQREQHALVIPLNDYINIPAEKMAQLLEGLQGVSLLVLEDLGRVVGRPEWEELLFHLLNQARDGGVVTLITAREPPQALKVELPDLRSRVAEAVVGQLTPLGDAQKWRVLQQRAERRGMSLSDEVVHFLMNRTARDFHTLFTLLDQLDRETLIAQRKITIPFVKKLLAL